MNPAIDRHTHRWPARQTDRWPDRQMASQTDGQTDRWADRQMASQTDGQSDRQMASQTDGQTDRQTDGQRQTYIGLDADGDDLLPGSRGQAGDDRGGTLVFGYLHGLGQSLRLLLLHFLLARTVPVAAGTWLTQQIASDVTGVADQEMSKIKLSFIIAADSLRPHAKVLSIIL